MGVDVEVFDEEITEPLEFVRRVEIEGSFVEND